MWNAEDAEEEVLAMVVRTGLDTCMGSMIRQLIAPAWSHKDKHPFIQVTSRSPAILSVHAHKTT